MFMTNNIMRGDSRAEKLQNNTLFFKLYSIAIKKTGACGRAMIKIKFSSNRRKYYRFTVEKKINKKKHRTPHRFKTGSINDDEGKRSPLGFKKTGKILGYKVAAVLRDLSHSTSH